MTEKEVLRTISGARLAVGMRLHFIILSLLAGIPVVGIAYDPKVLSICEKFGLPYTTLDNLAVLPELIERELGRLSKTRGRLKKLLAAEQKLAGRTLNAVLEALRG
jgi:polysaccharide pyruvyl transferase WcaK-like protein